ncbi:MAG: hypothetical protein MHM6MM_003814, partial [Cercozoa sp. M6MM]
MPVSHQFRRRFVKYASDYLADTIVTCVFLKSEYHERASLQLRMSDVVLQVASPRLGTHGVKNDRPDNGRVATVVQKVFPPYSHITRMWLHWQLHVLRVDSIVFYVVATDNGEVSRLTEHLCLVLKTECSAGMQRVEVVPWKPAPFVTLYGYGEHLAVWHATQKFRGVYEALLICDVDEYVHIPTCIKDTVQYMRQSDLHALEFPRAMMFQSEQSNDDTLPLCSFLRDSGRGFTKSDLLQAMPPWRRSQCVQSFGKSLFRVAWTTQPYLHFAAESLTRTEEDEPPKASGALETKTEQNLYSQTRCAHISVHEPTARMASHVTNPVSGHATINSRSHLYHDHDHDHDHDHEHGETWQVALVASLCFILLVSLPALLSQFVSRDWTQRHSRVIFSWGVGAMLAALTGEILPHTIAHAGEHGEKRASLLILSGILLAFLLESLSHLGVSNSHEHAHHKHAHKEEQVTEDQCQLSQCYDSCVLDSYNSFSDDAKDRDSAEESIIKPEAHAVEVAGMNVDANNAHRRGRFSVVLKDVLAKSLHHVADGAIIAAMTMSSWKEGLVIALAILAHEIPCTMTSYAVYTQLQVPQCVVVTLLFGSTFVPMSVITAVLIGLKYNTGTAHRNIEVVCLLMHCCLPGDDDHSEDVVNKVFPPVAAG